VIAISPRPWRYCRARCYEADDIPNILGLELGAAIIVPFVIQYDSCRYEQMIFVDHRLVLRRRIESRTEADGQAAKWMMNQTSTAKHEKARDVETDAERGGHVRRDGKEAT